MDLNLCRDGGGGGGACGPVPAACSHHRCRHLAHLQFGRLEQRQEEGDYAVVERFGRIGVTSCPSHYHGWLSL